MNLRNHFSREDAQKYEDILGIDWSKFGLDQFRQGMDVELEHGRGNPLTNVTGDDPLTTAKIALAHLNEFPDYYTRLKKMEDGAEAFWQLKPARKY